jgi:predicted RNase H-like HicB family nuclease
MPSYIALIRKEPGSDYGVEFPDFPGCVTAGIDLDDARRMAAEALALHIKGMLEDGETLPAPSAPETVMRDALNREAVGFLVDTPAAGVASVRVNITLPQDLLEAIDRVAGNRSRFLAEAARSKLRTG